MPGAEQFIPITITTTSVEEDEGRAVVHLIGEEGELWPPARLDRDGAERLLHQLEQFLAEDPGRRR